MSETFQHPVQRQDRDQPQPVAGRPRLRATRGWATASILTAGAFTATSLGTTMTAFAAQSAIEDILAGAPGPDLLPYDVFGIIYSAVGALALVVTCIWLARARANAVLIRPQFRHERSSVWVWLAWFVPVVSLWFPRQVVRDIHRGSSPTGAVPPGLDLWWGLWLGSLFLTQLADRLALGSDFELLSWLGPLNAASTVLMVAALVLWVRIVQSVARLQDVTAPPA